MRQLEKVLWSKGVLLNPQHLQVQDRYVEELLEFRLDALTFCPWGFSRLEIDRDALAGGVIGISEAAGLMPDGLIFDIPAADAAPAPLLLGEHWRADEPALMVHLVIPEHRPGSRNVATGGSTADTRYIAEIVLRRDENTGHAEKPIQVAKRNLRLVAAGESLEGAVSLPVARVLRGAGGAPELDASFIPPVLAIGASAVLAIIARRIVELLSAKSTALAAMRRQRNVGLADFGVADIANFWLLYTVNTHLPRIRHVFETRRAHPAVLYTAMLELAGTLMTFARSGHPQDLPAYEHGDLTGCFTRLDATVRALLETAVPAHHASLPLRLTEASVYAAALDQDRYLSAPQIYLAVAAGSKQDELIRRVPQLLKVSSADQIERLIRHGLAGVSLTHVPSPPSAIPVQLNYQYFLLERSGEDWDAIRMSRHLAVHVPADLPDPQLELVIVLPAG
ncbi:MAG: type VI secretion system baseplate subunit TssK [Longimicrobiales bacterium]